MVFRIEEKVMICTAVVWIEPHRTSMQLAKCIDLDVCLTNTFFILDPKISSCMACRQEFQHESGNKSSTLQSVAEEQTKKRSNSENKSLSCTVYHAAYPDTGSFSNTINSKSHNMPEDVEPSTEQ